MTEAIYVPEEHAAEFVKVTRAGLAARPGTIAEVTERLERWCADTWRST